MNRRLFLQRSALLTAGIVVASSGLIDLERILWEPKRLWTGFGDGRVVGVQTNTVVALQALYKKTNTNLLEALKYQTPELVWLQKHNISEEWLIDSGIENRIPLGQQWH
jgi:hypothetical protein